MYKYLPANDGQRGGELVGFQVDATDSDGDITKPDVDLTGKMVVQQVEISQFH